MDGAFSIDDIYEGFWSPPMDLPGDADVEQPSSAAAAAGMIRSSSEWAFQGFLQEATDGIDNNKFNHHHNQPPPPIPIDPEECQAFLKSRLELACAAAASSQGSNGKAVEFASSAADIGSQVLNLSSSTANGRQSSKMQVKDFVGTVGAPPLPAISKKSVTQVRSTTSGSSGDLSDDDEAEGETEDTQNMDPADTKRMRRMLSNRESARRSRKRKQGHLTERETKVSQLREESSSLLKRLTDINQKYNESAVDNRVLKADVETLRAKVKMAEESVKRVTGLNSLFHAISETSAEISAQIQDDPTHHYFHSMSNIQDEMFEIARSENDWPNASVQRMGSLGHQQKNP